MKSEYSKPLIKHLRKGGWFKGRKVSLEPWDHYAYEMYPLAREILSEFGGLVITKYRSALERETVRFDFRPESVHKDSGEFLDLEHLLNRKFFPVALASSMHYEVLVDNSNRLLLRVRGEGFVHAGTDFTRVLEAILVHDGQFPESFVSQEIRFR